MWIPKIWIHILINIRWRSGCSKCGNQPDQNDNIDFGFGKAAAASHLVSNASCCERRRAAVPSAWGEQLLLTWAAASDSGRCEWGGLLLVTVGRCYWVQWLPTAGDGGLAGCEWRRAAASGYSDGPRRPWVTQGRSGWRLAAASDLGWPWRVMDGGAVHHIWMWMHKYLIHVWVHNRNLSYDSFEFITNSYAIFHYRIQDHEFRILNYPQFSVMNWYHEFMLMKSYSWIQIWYNEFLYPNAYTYEFIYECRVYKFEFIFMNSHIIISYMNSYTHEFI